MRLSFLIFILVDWLTIGAGFILSYHLQPLLLHTSAHCIGLSLYIALTAISATIFILVFLWQGVYHSRRNLLTLDFSRRLIRSTIMGCALAVLPFFYAPHQGDLRPLVTSAIVVVAVLLALQKSIVFPPLLRHLRPAEGCGRLLVIGDEHNAGDILKKALSFFSPGFAEVGFLSPTGAGLGRKVSTSSLVIKGQAEVWGGYADLESITLNRDVDHVWINDPGLNSAALQNLISRCRTLGLQTEIIGYVGDPASRAVEAVDLGGLVILREKKIAGRPLYSALKRLMDLMLGLFILLLTSPLFAIVCLWIRFDSPGPAFFRQDRIGQDGRKFRMLKFRTMFSETEPYSISPKNQKDPRITRAGRFLRRSSLDELPQILNVLAGSMSLVGPRPEMPFIVGEYNAAQRLRLAVKPGITGLWQISGDRAVPIHLNLDYDLYYIDNRSLLLDLVILWRTLRTAIRGI